MMNAVNDTSDIHILLVEDEPSISRLVDTVLRSDGYIVDVVPDFRQAIEHLADPSILAVIADTERGAQTTDLANFALLVSAAGERPVLLFSAHRFHESAILAAGLVGWIRKPFDINDLLGKVRVALSLDSERVQGA